MDEKKIAILVQKNQEQHYARCVESLNVLKYPAGYDMEVLPFAGEASYAKQINEILGQTDAKYKIFLSDDICLVSPDFLLQILEVFQDKSIGMVGFLGAQSMPISGNLMESAYKCGRVYMPQADDFAEMNFDATDRDEPSDVRCILPSLFAMQYDYRWDENFQTPYYAVLAQCQAAEQAGHRVVVPVLETPWCAYQKDGIAMGAGQADRERFFQTYYPYLEDAKDAKAGNMLFSCGAGAELAGWQDFSCPEGIAVGRKARIHKTAICRLPFANFAGNPRITIGEGCEIGAGTIISAANKIVLDDFVSLAENIRIKDYELDHTNIGLPMREQKPREEGCEVHIGRAAWLEEDVSIRGNVHIGRGCIVRAGSVVLSDIPDYCAAAGNPARVVEAFSPKAGKWIPVVDETELAKLLEERKRTPPILTYAVITYNRSRYLVKSLRSVLQQAGNDDIIEILVSDNASEDDTRNIVQDFQKKYKNLRYHRNEKNVGAEGNIHAAMRESKGEYVIVAGDDDYLVNGAVHFLVAALYQYRGHALFYRVWAQNPDIKNIHTGKGYLEYLGAVGCGITWISAVAMRRDLYNAIRDPQRYDDTRLPQVYLQLEILKQKPEFVILQDSVFTDETGDYFSTGYNIAEIFIKNYLDILQATVELPPEQLTREKKMIMELEIYPLCIRLKRGLISLSLDGLFDIVKEYYGNEDFYPEVVAKLKELLD